MSTDKQEIEKLIMAIIESGQYAIKHGCNLGGYVRGFFHGDEYIPASWPTFTEGWLDDEFYRRPLTLEIIVEWLEHLFNMKCGEPDTTVGLKTISDQQVGRVARAFWRRIYPYRNKYGIELGKDVPIELLSHMATALTFIDEENIKNLQQIDIGEPEPDMFWFGNGSFAESPDNVAIEVSKYMEEPEPVVELVERAIRLKSRRMKIVPNKDGSVKSWDWVE